MISKANISACDRYSYSLERVWDKGGYKNLCLFIMLNPSTADAHIDDPTIRRCIGFAKSWGYGGILVGNLYAFRAWGRIEAHAAFVEAERDYYKARCAVAEEALKEIIEHSGGSKKDKAFARGSLLAIAESEKQ